MAAEKDAVRVIHEFTQSLGQMIIELEKSLGRLKPSWRTSWGEASGVADYSVHLEPRVFVIRHSIDT